MSPTRFRLQAVIDEKQTSQSELSRRSGVSLPTINRMCKNKTAQVSLATLDRLAEALEVPPGEIIERYVLTEQPKRGKTR